MRKVIDKSLVDGIDRQFYELMNANEKVMKDGIMCFDKYNDARIRIMWVLKQNTDYEEGYRDYSGQLAENSHRINSSPTWRRLAHASCGLISGERDFNKVHELGTEEYYEFMSATAIIEACKELGDTRSQDDDILDGFKRYKKLVFSQISAYNPDVIIVPMVGRNECLKKPIVEEIYKHFSGQNEYIIGGNVRRDGPDVAWSKTNDKVFLWAYHPSYTIISDKDYFDSLVEAYDTAQK